MVIGWYFISLLDMVFKRLVMVVIAVPVCLEYEKVGFDPSDYRLISGI